jgi:hypothetical protein
MLHTLKTIPLRNTTRAYSAKSSTPLCKQYPQDSVLQRINIYNNNILHLRFEIDNVERVKGSYVDEAEYFDELEEMYAEIAKLKDRLRDVKTLTCACLTDGEVPRCCSYDV